MGEKKSGNKKASQEGESPAPERTEPAQEEQQQPQPQPEEEIKKEEKPQQKEEEEQVEEIVTAPEHQVGVDPETGEAIMGTERAKIDFEAEFLKDQEQAEEKPQEEANQAREEAGGQEKESEPEEEFVAPAPAVVKVEKQASVGNVASTPAEFSRKTESVQEESVSKKPLLHQEKLKSVPRVPAKDV